MDKWSVIFVVFVFIFAVDVLVSAECGSTLNCTTCITAGCRFCSGDIHPTGICQNSTTPCLTTGGQDTEVTSAAQCACYMKDVTPGSGCDCLDTVGLCRYCPDYSVKCQPHQVECSNTNTAECV